MTGDKLAELFNRLGRLSAASKEKAGTETAWTYTDPDGETHRYVVRGVKSHSEMEDDIFNVIVWIWNAKDYLRKRAKDTGKNPEMVNEAIKLDPYLSALSDLANGLKHGEFKNHALGKISFTVPGRAVKSITLGAPRQVETDIANPSLVEYRLPIIDQTGKQVGDAFEYAERAIAALECIRDTIEEPGSQL